MSQRHLGSVTKSIKKKLSRKLSLSNISSLSRSGSKTSEKSVEIPFCEDVYQSARIRDNVKEKYNLDLGELAQHIEKELSSSSQDDSSCWSPESILNLIDSLRVPLELIVKVIQAVKSTIK